MGSRDQNRPVSTFMNKKRLISTAIDAVGRFRSGPFPLKNVGQDLIKARKLNSGERKAFLDLIFRFSREINLLNKFFNEKIRFSNGMSVQERDTLALEILSESIPALFEPGGVAALYQDYEQWLVLLGDERYLLALGPLISGLLIADHQEQALAIAKGLAYRPAKYLAVDRRYLSVDVVSDALSGLGLEHFRHPILPVAIGSRHDINLKDLPKGMADHIWFMDAGSQIIAELVCPKPHEWVLDLCAGEGGKAQYITMKDCHYVALDVDESRLERAKKRLHNQKVDFVKADGRSPPFPSDHFDWILLDAPCSGTGVLRRHPDLVHRLTKAFLDKYRHLQRDLLKSAVKLLKPGGKLIYATCSLFRSENEQQIHDVLRENSQILPLSLSHLVGEHLRFSDDALYDNSLTLYPHIHDCDGFYVACLTKARE